MPRRRRAITRLRPVVGRDPARNVARAQAAVEGRRCVRAMRPSTFSRTAILVGPLVGLLFTAPAEAQGPPSGWRGRPPEPAAMAMPGGTGRLRNGARGMCLDVAGW